MSGKGSAPRPFSIPKEQFNQQWETIFGDRKKREEALEEMVRINEELGLYNDPPKPMESLDPR